MASGLQRDLGLPATTAIAIGAMVSSGIFNLTVSARSTVLETDDSFTHLRRFVGDADLLVTGATGPA